MKRIRYSKYVDDDFGIPAEDLIKALSDFLLSSGFESDLGFSEMNEHTMESLKEAIRRALESGELFDPDRAEQIRQRLENMPPEELDQVLNRLVQKLEEQGYVSVHGDGEKDAQNTTVQVTDKSVDFLGFKTLKDLMGALGRSSFGAHETRELATGVESSGSAKQWEFGDTLNLDTTATLFSALRREGLEMPLNLEYQDLHVHQCEYQSSCATVLMLDCSHSMILMARTASRRRRRSRSRYRTSSARSFRETRYDACCFTTLPKRSDSENWRGCKWGLTTPTRATA